jgi:CheY-like chemotaxis protein
MQRTLQDWGMLPTVVVTGAGALDILRMQPGFDIAVIDMQMPDMSGLSLAKEFRKLSGSFPIIMTSGLGFPMHVGGANQSLHDLPILIGPTANALYQREPIRQLGVRHVISKPIKPSILREALLDHLDMVVPSLPDRIEDKLAHAAGGSDTTLGERHPLRILIADDNVTNQKVAVHMLKRLGYRADIAANGLEALDSFRARAYNVILMDIQMPEMDGLDATRCIRADFSSSVQPYIIAITAASSQIDRTKCLAAGMDDFLAKPIRLEDLTVAIHQYLRISADAS